MMNMFYGMEIMQSKDKITMYGEMNDMYRRIFSTTVSHPGRC